MGEHRQALSSLDRENVTADRGCQGSGARNEDLEPHQSERTDYVFKRKAWRGLAIDMICPKQASRAPDLHIVIQYLSFVNI